MTELLREIRFALSESMVRWTLIVALVLSGLALLNGLHEINRQNEQLALLNAETVEDQSYVLPAQSDAGSAAYYVFHLTYDPPSDLAYAALGMRKEFTWKHRIRMLALEGQIYESDPGNPELSLLGKLDFSIVASILLPLLLIGLLYDLDARERRESRYELLCATSKKGKRVLLYRACARSVLLFSAIILPFIISIILSATVSFSALKIILSVALHSLFWLLVCRLVATRQIEGSTAAVTLFGVWLLLTSVVPVVGKYTGEKLFPVPNGGEILLTQRETVNDAWDLPKEETMTPFVEAHPGWKNDASIELPFEWKWYYAFQQVGDQKSEPLSTALYQGMSNRDEWMGFVSILSPPLLAERWINQTAKTDIPQHLHYINCVRKFHAELRKFYYPVLFGRVEYSNVLMEKMPQFEPCKI